MVALLVFLVAVVVIIMTVRDVKKSTLIVLKVKFSWWSLDKKKRKNVLDRIVRRHFTDMPTQITVSFYSGFNARRCRNRAYNGKVFFSRVWRLFFNTFSLCCPSRQPKSRSWQGDERLQECLGTFYER